MIHIEVKQQYGKSRHLYDVNLVVEEHPFYSLIRSVDEGYANERAESLNELLQTGIRYKTHTTSS